MDRKKLRRIKQTLKNLRSRPNNIRSKELRNFAKQLGRRRFNRGHEPNFLSDLLPKSRPISIPDHPGSMARFTAENILDQLEQDIFELEEMLGREQK